MLGRGQVLSCVLLLTTAGAGGALAGPLNKRVVSGDATWVIHVDVEAAVASTLGRAALEEDEAKQGLRELRSEFGVDLIRDIKGITLWGHEAEGEDAVVVVHTSAVVDDVLAKFREEAGIEEVEAGGYEILKWSDGDETHYGHVRKTRQGDDRMVFIARSEDDLVLGLEVADGEEPSAASENAVIKDKPGEGAIVFVSIPQISTLVPGHALEEIPAIFGKIQGLRLEAGERGDEMFVDAAVIAATSEDAATVQQLAQGALAFCKLAGSSEPEVAEFAKFAEKIRIGAEDRTVTFRIRCGTDEVREVIAKVREHEHKGSRTSKDRDEGAREDDDRDDPESPVAPAEKPRRKRGS